MATELYPRYTPEHLAAFAVWRSHGFELAALTEQQLKDLSTDYQTGLDISRWRAHRDAKAAEAAERATREQQQRLRQQQPTPVKKKRPGWTERLAEEAIQRFDKAFDGADAWPEFVEFVKAHPSLPMPLAVVSMFAIGPVVGMNARNKERNEKIAWLEQRVAQLEARPELKYDGVWENQKIYDPGTLTTFRGSLWIAKEPSVSKAPGTDTRHWQLCCKAGRDGRDAVPVSSS